MPAHNNFAWTVVSDEGDLLAFQEKGTESKVVLIDEQRAIETCRRNIMAVIDDHSLDYLAQIKALGTWLFTYRKVTGQEDEPKSLIIKPGQF